MKQSLGLSLLMPLLQAEEIQQCGKGLSPTQEDECRVWTKLYFLYLHVFQDRLPNWVPPFCDMETQACKQAEDDKCSYSCISKDQCEGKIETIKFGDDFLDGYVCNCVDQDPKRFEFVWSCDNTPIVGNSSETQHQYG